jgi:hypothetical protein
MTKIKKPKAKPQDPTIAWPTRERQRMGDFTEARTFEFEPDEGGRLSRKAVRTIRDRNASAAGRLAGKHLSQGQLMAAITFEKDYETSCLSAKVTANLMGSGGGALSDMPALVLSARDRVHYAREALRLGGEDIVRVVEDIVLDGSGITAVGLARKANKAAGLAWANLALETGLNLLQAHYRANGRMTG